MTYAIATLVLAALGASDYRDLVCRTEEGYVVRREAELLDCGQFNEADLRRVFRRRADPRIPARCS